MRFVACTTGRHGVKSKLKYLQVIIEFNLGGIQRARDLMNSFRHFQVRRGIVSQITSLRMSTLAEGSPNRQRFWVYAPDKTAEGTFERRLSVRATHLESAKERISKGIIRWYYSK